MKLHPIAGGSSAEVERLAEEVAQISGAVDSTVAFIAGLKGQLQAVAGDRAATLALAEDLDRMSTKLGVAIATDPEPPGPATGAPPA